MDVSDPNVAEPSGESWSDAEMHAAMLARRDASNLDAEWRYHVLAAHLLDSTPRGIMYDAFGTDSNNVPREGLGISSHWVIPNASPWGTVKSVRFGAAAAPYFRTAVHELGHAMGLFHNTVDNGFMNTTDVIAASCAATFPACIQWSFAADDQKRLRHYPDVFVRPGGTAFGTASTTTPAISPTDLTMSLTFACRPMRNWMPWRHISRRSDVRRISTSERLRSTVCWRPRARRCSSTPATSANRATKTATPATSTAAAPPGSR